MACIRKVRVQKEPTPRFVGTLLSCSEEKASWRAACAEWTPVDYLESDHPVRERAPSSEDGDFVSNCQLCGSRLYLHNYVIQNVLNLKKMVVGSECINRFESLNGLGSSEDVVTYIDRWTREQQYAPRLKMLAVAFKFVPIDRAAFHEFRRTAEGAFGPICSLPDWESKGPRILEACGTPADSLQALRIRMAFLEPTSLPLDRPEGKRSRQETEAELRRKYGWTAMRKRKRHGEVVTSGRSELYQENRLDPLKKDKG